MTEDNFDTTIPAEILPLLLDLGIEFNFDPTSSIEMENFFNRLVDQFVEAGGGDFLAWIRRAIECSFRCVSSSPEWIQNPAWPISGGRPMVFVAQVDVPAEAHLLHGGACFYLFYDAETGACQTVIQTE